MGLFDTMVENPNGMDGEQLARALNSDTKFVRK